MRQKDESRSAVEQSVLGVSGMLRQIGIPRATIYNCYNYYLFPY